MNAFMVVVFEFFIFSVVIQIHGAGPTATTGQEVTRADGERIAPPVRPDRREFFSPAFPWSVLVCLDNTQ